MPIIYVYVLYMYMYMPIIIYAHYICICTLHLYVYAHYLYMPSIHVICIYIHIGLFDRILSLLWVSFAKETYTFKEPIYISVYIHTHMYIYI